MAHNNQSIYCYCEYCSDDEEELYLLGFMDSINHAYDSDCFHTILCKKDFDNSIKKINSYMKENYYSCINSDNDNWRYIIDKKDIRDIMYDVRHFAEI